MGREHQDKGEDHRQKDYQDNRSVKAGVLQLIFENLGIEVLHQVFSSFLCPQKTRKMDRKLSMMDK